MINSYHSPLNKLLCFVLFLIVATTENFLVGGQETEETTTTCPEPTVCDCKAECESLLTARVAEVNNECQVSKERSAKEIESLTNEAKTIIAKKDEEIDTLRQTLKETTENYESFKNSHVELSTKHDETKKEVQKLEKSLSERDLELHRTKSESDNLNEAVQRLTTSQKESDEKSLQQIEKLKATIQERTKLLEEKDKLLKSVEDAYAKTRVNWSLIRGDAVFMLELYVERMVSLLLKIYNHSLPIWKSASIECKESYKLAKEKTLEFGIAAQKQYFEKAHPHVKTALAAANEQYAEHLQPHVRTASISINEQYIEHFQPHVKTVSTAITEFYDDTVQPVIMETILPKLADSKETLIEKIIKPVGIEINKVHEREIYILKKYCHKWHEYLVKVMDKKSLWGGKKEAETRKLIDNALQYFENNAEYVIHTAERIIRTTILVLVIILLYRLFFAAKKKKKEINNNNNKVKKENTSNKQEKYGNGSIKKPSGSHGSKSSPNKFAKQ